MWSPATDEPSNSETPSRNSPFRPFFTHNRKCLEEKLSDVLQMDKAFYKDPGVSSLCFTLGENELDNVRKAPSQLDRDGSRRPWQEHVDRSLALRCRIHRSEND